MIVLPVTILIMALSNDIVQVIYGSTYQSAPIFLATYCLLYLLVGVGYFTLTSFYNGLGETKATLKISLITFLVLATMSPILAKTYSVIGLIVAFLIASTAGISYGSYTARTKFKIEFDTKLIAKIYLISILSSLTPLLVVRFLPLPKLFNVVVGGLLYLFTYVTLIPTAKIIDYSEVQSATHILQKIKPLTLITLPLLKYEEKILNFQKTQNPSQKNVQPF